MCALPFCGGGRRNTGKKSSHKSLVWLIKHDYGYCVPWWEIVDLVCLGGKLCALVGKCGSCAHLWWEIVDLTCIFGGRLVDLTCIFGGK